MLDIIEIVGRDPGHRNRHWDSKCFYWDWHSSAASWLPGQHSENGQVVEGGFWKPYLEIFSESKSNYKSGSQAKKKRKRKGKKKEAELWSQSEEERGHGPIRESQKAGDRRKRGRQDGYKGDLEELKIWSLELCGKARTSEWSEREPMTLWAGTSRKRRQWY